MTVTVPKLCQHHHFCLFSGGHTKDIACGCSGGSCSLDEGRRRLRRSDYYLSARFISWIPGIDKPVIVVVDVMPYDTDETAVAVTVWTTVCAGWYCSGGV